MKRPPTKQQVIFMNIVRAAKRGNGKAKRIVRDCNLYIWTDDERLTYEQFKASLERTATQQPYYVTDYYIRVRRNLYSYEDAKLVWYKPLTFSYFLFKLRFEDSGIGYYIAQSINKRIKILCNVTWEARHVYRTLRPTMSVV